ncbi:MAG: hypothetical protein IPL61_25085 [Myxococcales bacterium]|nr:hypothetical protein [Myxococcales bacterium]
MRAPPRTLVGLGLICFANLLLSVLMTRVFSATMFYHFTFLAVALAMFGVAASGVYVFIHDARLRADPAVALRWAARWFGVATIAALIYALANPIDILFYYGTGKVPNFAPRQFWQLVLLVLVSAAPFFFSGVVVSLCLTIYTDNVNRVYFADLLGAAAATLVTGLLLKLLGGPNAVLVVAGLAFVSGHLLAPTRWTWVAPVVVLALIIVNARASFIEVPSGKGVAAEKVAFEEWNIFSRVTVDQGGNIKIDASAATQIHDLRKLRPGLQAVEITALAHAIFDGGADRALVIGPGGGRDVLHALAAGAKDVTAVEINPIIGQRIMRERFAERSGRLYFDPRVHLVVDDGRSFVRRQAGRFDLIQASLVDTFAATAAGAFALSENTLYTVEAFADYYQHLTERGVVTMTRWHTGERNETARLLLLAAAGLEAVGVPAGQARRHMIYVVAPKLGLGTLIAKRGELTDAELDRVSNAAAQQGWTVAVSPRTSGAGLLERMLDAGPDGALVRSQAEDLSPPTDDRPFFFYFKKLGDLFSPSKKMSDPALWILVSLGSVLVLALVFIVLPLVTRAVRGDGPRSPESLRAKVLTLAYFGLVGFAFMAVEIGLLQRMTLFLGHPSYSLVVVLFGVLLATAFGAFFAERIPTARLGAAMALGGGALLVLAGFYALALTGVIHGFIAHGLTVRIALALAFIAPAGLVMGSMVPGAVRVLGARGSLLVPWGWGVNGATSVLGSVISTVVAIYGGFSAVFWLGGLCYAAAGVAGLAMARVRVPGPAVD